MQRPGAPHLCPFLIFHGAAPSALTPFCLVPLKMIEQAWRVLRLASVPLHFFRFYPPPKGKLGTTYPLDLYFHQEGSAFLPARAATGRPVVMWTSVEDPCAFIAELARVSPVLLLVVTDSEEARQAVEAMEVECVFGTVSVFDTADESPAPDAPSRIWARYLELVLELFERAGGEGPEFRIAPDVRPCFPLSALADAARGGALSPFMVQAPAVPVPNDYVVAPNRILLAYGRQQVPHWEGGPLPREEAHAAAASDAAKVLSTRGFNNLVELTAQARDEGREDSLFEKLSMLPADFIERFRAASSQASDEERWISPLAELYDMLPAELSLLSPPQVILVSPSMSLLPESARRILHLGVSGEDEIDRMRNLDPDYFEHVLSEARVRGRELRVVQPSTDAQQEILDGVLTAIRGESQILSGLATLYATRFACPVLKGDRLDDAFLDPFGGVRLALEQSEISEAGDEDAAKELCETVSRLSATSTEYLPAEYLDLIGSRHDFLVHGFSDWPLEFVRVDGDYLGYKTHLSRTPLTPGDVALANYWSTEHTSRLPTRPEEFLFVTPFEDDDDLRGLIQAPGPDIPPFEREIVRRKTDLLEHLEDPDVGCLVYFGHGYHDDGSDETALVLQEQYLRSADLHGLKRVPPLVILIGCNTAAAGIHLGGIHTALFRAGAQLIVGTSFPVPRGIGLTFLANFIRNFLSPGVVLSKDRTHQYRDIAEIVTTCRRRMRVFTDIVSLVEQGAFSPEDGLQANKLMVEKSTMMSEAEVADDWNLLAAWRELSELTGVTAPDCSVYDWGVIPYPLFFSVLGFPWTNRSEHW